MNALVFAIPALLSAAAWLYLVAGHGRFWLADQRLPVSIGDEVPEGGWPSVVAVVPARDEAGVLPLTLPTLLGQDYPGELRIVLVDDASSDGTAQVAEKLAAERPNRTFEIVHSDGPPQGWAGKVAAMNRGFAAAMRFEPARSEPAPPEHALAEPPQLEPAPPESVAPEYVLFTDADIAHRADSLRRLVAFGEARELGLVSLMVRLRTETAAERAIVPAFVYSFAQLYPFPQVNRPRSRVAAAAGGCMLVRRSALIEAGGLSRIAGARIDDVALGRLLKRSGHRIWLGLTTSVHSIRPYPRLADLWNMIARSAYVQLRHSPLLLGGTLLGLLLLYAVPPVFGLGFLIAALAGGGGWQTVTAAAGLAGWALMLVSYLPTLRLYRLAGWRAALLPLVMMLYGAMTFDSARRHYRGNGGRWKGRVEG